MNKMTKGSKWGNKNVNKGKWDFSKKRKFFVKRLTRNILEKTYDGTAIAFIILKALGEGTLGAFLKRPTYYIDDPSEFLGEISMFKNRKIQERQIKRTILRLQKYGLVKKDGSNMSLSKKGVDLASKILGYKKQRREEWDGKYRLVIFDIPETHSHHRNWLRGELYFLGYKKLQNSVFVSKLSLTEDIIKEIKEREIENYVNYLLVENIHDLKKGTLDI